MNKWGHFCLLLLNTMAQRNQETDLKVMSLYVRNLWQRMPMLEKRVEELTDEVRSLRDQIVILQQYNSADERNINGINTDSKGINTDLDTRGNIDSSINTNGINGHEVSTSESTPNGLTESHDADSASVDGESNEVPRSSDGHRQ
jgi:hypothetical protein